MKLSIEALEKDPWGAREILFQFRFRTSEGIGILVVILIHIFLAYMLFHMGIIKINKGNPAGEPIVMILPTNKEVSKVDAAPPARSKPAPARAQPKNTITLPQPRPVEAQPSPVEPPPVAKAEPEMDMMSMVNAAREKRRLEEENARNENELAARGKQGLSEKERVEAAIRKSVDRATGKDGTSGVFSILSKSTRVATFSFHGWKTSASNSWKQVIEVDAGLGGNIELAVVRRMIQIIRTHYQGNFSWDSHRLGRVVTLSARPEDSAALEEFLMKEFFGNGR